MTPAHVNLMLTELQLERRQAAGGERVLMWTMLMPTDEELGRSFVCHVRFERGPDSELRFTLDAPIPLDDESLDRLDDAIFRYASHWRH